MRPALAIALLLALVACDRKIEPFDPNEQPAEPDLTRIFPEGAERAAQAEPGLPAAPGSGRGAPSLPSETASAEAGAPIEGTVVLGPGLEAPPGAVLFIIARMGEGGPPTAVKRLPDPHLPLAFRIGPEDRMIQAMPFTGPFRLSARLDGDGNAASRSPGDLQGAIDEPVAPGATGLELVLDEVL